MTPPFRPSPSAAASAPRGCGGDRCASARDAWPLHHVRHDGVFCRLCSSCVLLYHPGAFCSACLLLLPHDTAVASQEPHLDPILSPPGPTAACSGCGLFVAHVSCVLDSASFVCPPCAAAANRRPFSYDLAGGGQRALDERAARVLLTAALLSHDSVLRAAAEAREKAERSGREAAAARKRSRDMLDVASRALEAEALEAEARDAKKPAAPPAAEQPKKKTPKRSEANRDKDKLLKLKAMQQPALAFAAAAAAAALASSMPLSMPSSRETTKAAKQGARGSAGKAAKNNRKALFGTLQS